VKTMKITVALCTFSGCLHLAEVLEGLSVSTVPDPVEWAVPVVDDNSDDQTRRATVVATNLSRMAVALPP
jgi:glycosyltransferase involved in cell wall biosynthesis